MLRTSHDNTFTTARADIVYSPHSKNGVGNGVPEKVKDQEIAGKQALGSDNKPYNPKMSQNTLKNFTNFKVSGLKLVLQRNNRQAAGSSSDRKKMILPNLQMNPTENQ